MSTDTVKFVICIFIFFAELKIVFSVGYIIWLMLSRLGQSFHKKLYEVSIPVNISFFLFAKTLYNDDPLTIKWEPKAEQKNFQLTI